MWWYYVLVLQLSVLQWEQVIRNGRVCCSLNDQFLHQHVWEEGYTAVPHFQDHIDLLLLIAHSDHHIVSWGLALAVGNIVQRVPRGIATGKSMGGGGSMQLSCKGEGQEMMARHQLVVTSPNKISWKLNSERYI